MLFRNQRAAHIHDILQKLREGYGFTGQINFSALNFGHIQDLIDQVEQMPAGYIDLRKTVLYFFRRIQVGLGNNGHTHNGIHRRPDIMGHGGKEIGLGRICHPGRIISLLQRLPLTLLFHAFGRHIYTKTVKRRNIIPAFFLVYIA